MTLKSFPRGWEKPHGPKSFDSKTIKKNPKTKRDRENRKRQDEEEHKEETNLVADTAERLSLATLCEGMTILGRVSEATDYDLIVSLPGGIVGRVQVTDISESYSNLLQSIIKSENEPTNEFKPLPELYSPGDYIVCYVKSIQPEEKWQITLSLESQLINQNIDISYLSENSKVICNVSSKEDHGYVVDMGISTVRSFIPNKEVNGKMSYFPGKQLLCNVKEIKRNEGAATVKLSTVQSDVQSQNNGNIEVLNALMPGARFPLRVKKVLFNGLQVAFGKNSVGYVNQLYLDRPLSSYENGKRIIGTLLYILPTLKFGYFSLIVNKTKSDTLKAGDTIEKATVLFRTNNGIVLQLTENDLRGFLPLKRTEIDHSKVVEKFAPGTKHKCRVLAYNWMDNVYICTMQQTLLEQRYFSVSDIKSGDVTNVKIKHINTQTGFVTVSLGKIIGFVAPEHVSDAGLSALKKLKVGEQMEARVLGIDNEKTKVYFTLKKSLLISDLPVLSNIHEAKLGSQYHGTVVKINRFGLLVRFFEDVKGWVPRNALEDDASDVKWNYSIGQTVAAKIESVNDTEGKIILSIGAKRKKRESCSFIIGEEVEGTVVESSIQGVYLRIVKNNGENVTTGFLPAGHMSPCLEIATLLASKCIPGDTMTALVFATVPSLILSRTFLPQQKYRNFNQLQIGDCIPCSVRDIEQDGVRVTLPIMDGSPFEFISYSNISNFNLLYANQTLFAKIVSINKKETRLNLTMLLKKVYDSIPDSKARLTLSVDVLNLYFNKLLELARYSFYESRPISTVRLGQKLTGKIEKITNDNLVIQLDNNLVGIVHKDHYLGSPKIGEEVTGIVMWKNYIHEFVNISLLPAIVDTINPNQHEPLNLPEDTLLRARILMVTNWFILIILRGKGKGTLAALPARRHLNDLQPNLTPYVVHVKLRCYVMIDRNESNIMPICMVKSAFEVDKSEKSSAKQQSSKRKAQENDKTCVPNKKSKIQEVATVASKKKEKKNHGTIIEEEDRKKTIAEAVPNKKKKEKRAKQVDQEAEKSKNDKNKSEEAEKTTIPECGFFWDTTPDVNLLKQVSSSDSEEEAEKEAKHKKKKLNAMERRERERQIEREIRQREEALASNQLPNSVDQFDRLVLASPDSSLVWLQYMAYHLQATEIDKARIIAKRAIKTISFREENEKLNVWNAWLNLESKFGTPETLENVYQEALRANEALKIYMHMLTVHVDAGRQAELEKVITTMIGKFKQNPEVWIECGTAFLKMGLKEKSRHIMQRALQSLPTSHHVNLMVRFAILENKFGDKERSQTLFEQILSSYPKRVDVWSSYVDSLVKGEDIDIARKVLERAIIQVLPVRKMKTLFKKFITFEEQHGTAEGVARVQEMAVEFVEKQCSKESF